MKALRNFAALITITMLTACGASGKAPSPNSVAGQRALQAAQKANAPTAAPLPTDEPTPAPIDALAVPWEATPAPNGSGAIDTAVPAYDGFVTQALPYGGLAALQFLIMAIATLAHPHGRRVGIALASFGLCAAAALLALGYGQTVDVIGFALVCVMGFVAMSHVFGRGTQPNRLPPPPRHVDPVPSRRYEL